MNRALPSIILPLFLALQLFPPRAAAASLRPPDAAAATAAATATAAALPPLERSLRLSLWGAGLNDFAREAKAQTGVDVLFFLADLPPDQNVDNLFLVTGPVPLGAALDVLAYRYRFRYRLSATGQIEVSKSYGWVGDARALRFARLPPLAGDDARPEATGRFLLELVKPLELLPGDFSLGVEDYPLPGRPEGLRLTAVLPPVLADYLVRAVRCFQGEAGDDPAGGGTGGAGGNLFARARPLPGDWGELLGRQLPAPRGDGGLKELLQTVADQAGVAILLDSLPGEGGGASGRGLPADILRYSLARLTEALAAEWGLGGRVFIASGGVVFNPGAGEGDYQLEGRNGEAFWDGLAVAGFAAKRAVEAAGGEEVVLRLLRREVFPWLWRDPVCGMLYSGATGRLVVVAPANAVRAVGERLARFGRE